jgi:hypothetical protein
MKEQLTMITTVVLAIVYNAGCAENDATRSSAGGMGGETSAGNGSGERAGAQGGGGNAGSAATATGGAGSGGHAAGAGGSSGAGGRAGSGAGGVGADGSEAGSAGDPTGEGGADAGAAGSTGSLPTPCMDPVFTTSDTNGGWSDGGYYVHNNVWNAGEAGPETLYACSYENWYVTSTQPDTTSVKAFPNVHLDIDDLDGQPISDYTTITSTFAATAPNVGIYNVAYDLWLDGVGWGNGTTELMIWTENRGQVPLGNIVSPQMTFGGETYDVYRYTSDSDGGVHVVSLLSTETQTSGSVDLKEILNWMVDNGWILSDATVNQIGYGVEICSTEGRPATFYFTDFSVTMN